MEAKALAKANISEDTITKKKYEDDSDDCGIEIVGVNPGNKPGSLIKKTALLSGCLLPAKNKQPLKPLKSA